MVTTREFRIEDYDSAVELWRRVEGLELAEGDSKEEIARYILRNPGVSRVAEEATKIVGAVLCGHDGRRGLVYHLAVEPEYRRQAVGKRLVEECLNALHTAGIRRALLLVAKDNISGRSFWHRCGWEDLPGALVMGIDV